MNILFAGAKKKMPLRQQNNCRCGRDRFALNMYIMGAFRKQKKGCWIDGWL